MTAIKPNARTIWLIHAAFMFAVLIYAGLAHFVFLPAPEKPVTTPLVSLVLLIVAVVSIPLGFWIPMFLPKSGISIKHSNSVLDSMAGGIIIGDAFFESIGVYGLVCAVLGRPAWEVDLFLVVSFVLLAIQGIRIRNDYSA